MNESSRQQIEEVPEDHGLPTVPELVPDRYGVLVDLRPDRIRFNDPTNLAVLEGVELGMFADEIKAAIKLWLARSIKKHSPRESCNQATEISIMLRRHMPARLSDLDLDWWQKLRHTMKTEDAEYRLHRLRAWFLWMANEGFPGIDEDVANAVEAWSIPGNVKGEDVKSQDTEKGPLTHLQYANLLSKVKSLYASIGITTGLALVKLCMNLGPNAKQIVLLEERDLSWQEDPQTGSKEYFLEVPRIKKRHGKRVTKKRHLLPETGLMLQELILKNRKRRKDKLGADTSHMPIFCRETTKQFPEGSSFRGRFDWHYYSGELTPLVRNFAIFHKLKTPGTDQVYSFSIRRLRYTFATRLAAQGAPPAAIAEALDHTDLQNVMVYVNATGQLVDRLDVAIGPHLKPYMDAFIHAPSEPKQAFATPETVFHPKPGQFIGIGSCGLKDQCHLTPPYSCYGCDFFHPWIEADHESVVAFLEEKKAKAVAARADAADRIPHQYDGAILAAKIALAAQKAKANGLLEELK